MGFCIFGYTFRFKFFPKSATDYFQKVFRAAIAQRETHRGELAEPKDLLDALLKIRKESQENNEGYEIKLKILWANFVIVIYTIDQKKNQHTTSIVLYKVSFMLRLLRRAHNSPGCSFPLRWI